MEGRKFLVLIVLSLLHTDIDSIMHVQKKHCLLHIRDP